MKTVKFGNILENAARLAGRQVALLGVPENWAALAALAIDEGIRRLAAEKFPMTQRVEFRRYRPEWLTNAGWVKGQECWRIADYYRLEADSPTAEPEVEGSGWRVLKMEEVAAFVAFDQPWEAVEIDRASVDATRFAFLADPKLCPDAAPVKAVGVNELGVTLQSPAPKGVFVKFTPKFPNLSFVEWSSATAYEAGDVAYLTATKDVYQALANVAAGGKSPDADADNWQPVRISDEFEGYLTRLAAVEMLTEDQGKHQTRAAADHAFEELCARHHEGMGETQAKVGRFCR